MYIGNPNDRAPLRAFTLTGEGGVALTAGNPFAGEALSVNWRKIVPFGLTMQLDFADSIWLDSIVLGFVAKSSPTAVTLLDTYDRIISAALPTLRENIRDVASPSLHPHTVLTIESGADLPADTRLDSLVIEHTATRARHCEPWKPFATIGSYTVTYADGETETIPVTYGGNIGHIGRRILGITSK